MNKLTATLVVTHEATRTTYQYGTPKTETAIETLCNINEQHFSKGMLGAALRQLADEVDPLPEQANAAPIKAWRNGEPVQF